MSHLDNLGVYNNELEQRALMITDKISEHLVVKTVPLDGFVYKKCGYKKGSEMPEIDASFKPFGKNDLWGGEADSHAWFYKKINFEKCLGRCELVVSSAIEGWDADNPQFMLYIDGKIVQGMDVNHTSAVINSFGEKDVYIYAYTTPEKADFYKFITEIRYIDEEAERLYYNLLIPAKTLGVTDMHTEEYQVLLKYLNTAINMLDLRKWEGKEYYDSVKKANEYLEKEFYEGHCKESSAKVACIGHTHIDVAWLWSVKQTYEKVQRSFATVCALMDRYPDYQFMSSQVPLYKAVKQEDPELYERIKRRVKEGRWQVEGGSYLEMDCNVPSGESLVRQFLYGKRFFNKEFGVDCKTLWLPDVFGYSAAMPQILRKCGIDKFVTSKISWNESNAFPYDSFMWRGIDGSEVFAHYITTQDYLDHPKGEGKGTTYVGHATPSQIKGAYTRYHHKDVTDEALATIGYGDGGGGTTPYDCEAVKRMQYGLPGMPTAKFRNVCDYLEKVYQNALANPRTPKWVGELYLEYHRGTYTSQANNKKFNRKSEFALINLESLGVIGEVKGLYAYDKKNLAERWETVLLNQFHDVLPGSSIKEVYTVTDKEYGELFNYADGETAKELAVLAANVNKKGILVYNPNPFEYSGAAVLKGNRYYCKNVPAKGYKVIDKIESESNVKVSERELDNAYFVLKFDENFNIISVYDKTLNREVLKDGKSIKFHAYEDYTYMYDAWELGRYYKEKEYSVDDVISVEKIYESDRAGLKITRKFVDSLITDTVYLYDNEKFIGFEDDIDWNAEHILLKRTFPIDVVTDKATCEIQFGSAERPTHQNTSWDAAKFEVCAHKYVDVSEENFGAAVVNDSKFGYSIVDNDVSLSLLKCATYPDPTADKGKHRIKYALYTHGGTVNSSDTANFAYKFNNPVYATETDGKGNLDGEYSLVKCDADNVFVETVKLAEDGDDIIARLFEAKRMRKTVTLTFGFDVKEAYLCDMLENESERLTVDGNSLTLTVKPFEVITLKLKR